MPRDSLQRTRHHEQQIAAQQVSEEARENFRREKRALKLTATVVFALLLRYVPVISFRIASSSNAFKNKLSLDVSYAIFFRVGMSAHVKLFN